MNPDSFKTSNFLAGLRAERSQIERRFTEQIVNQKAFPRVFGTPAGYSNLPEWPPKTMGRWACPRRALDSLFPAEVILTSARMRNL
jgi:hypothetical protein